MQAKSLRMFLALVLMVTLANAGRGRQFRNYRNSHRPSALLSLKTKLNACKTKFVCDVKSTGRMCEPICIDRDKLCNGMNDCDNLADEMNCPIPPTTPATTTTPTPTVPTTTPCPMCEVSCENNTFACDGVCHPIAQWCDNNTDCVDGSDEENCTECCGEGKIRCGDVCATLCNGEAECPNDLDEPSPNCDCSLSEESDICDNPVPTTADLLSAAGVTATIAQCLSLCRALDTCTGFFYGDSTCYLTEEIVLPTGSPCSPPFANGDVTIHPCKPIP